VRFPPGRARLVMRPLPSGSPTWTKMMGRVWVACLAAMAAGVPWVTSTSTSSRAKAAASAGSRSNSPSAHRNAMVTLWPSTQPSSRRPCRRASMIGSYGAGEELPRKPIRGTFARGCASAARSVAGRLHPRVTMPHRVQSHTVVTAPRLPVCLRFPSTLPILALMSIFLCFGGSLMLRFRRRR
jgi:hypothetical protein